MRIISIILDEEAFPVETVRIEPLERGRLAVFVKSPITLRKGESCTMRASTGADLECVVSDVYCEKSEQVTELRCIPEVDV